MSDKVPQNFRQLEGFFPSKDGTSIFYRLFTPGAPCEAMIFIHGHGEHSGRYLKFAHELRNEDMALAMMDLRGNGRSEGSEVYVNSLEEYIDDVSAFYQHLQMRHGIRGKIVLFGHSLGGLISIYWAMKNQEKIRQLIFSSPCFGLRLPGYLQALNSVLNSIARGFIYQNPIYPPHLSHNPQEMKDYKADKLIKRKISVRLVHEMLSYARNLQNFKSFNFDFPVYILMSEDMERVVDPSKTREVFEKIVAPEKRLLSFPGFYHEIFNELEQSTAFDALRVTIKEGRKFA